MKRLLLLCWCCSVLATTRGPTGEDKRRAARVHGFSCVSSYWSNITCVLNISSGSAGRSDTGYHLTFKDNSKGSVSRCPLVLTGRGHSCTCRVQLGGFSGYSNYQIQLCNRTGCGQLLPNFFPSKNIQLTPPQDAKFQETPETLNVTWKSGYEAHRYLASFLDYELSLQKLASSTGNTLSVGQKFAEIPKSQLDARATHCVKVRSKPRVEQYTATWSEWSPTACWENNRGAEQEQLAVILSRSLGPLCAVVGVLLFGFFGPAARLKIRALTRTPSPAPFFRPLFQQHDGDLQKWISPRHLLAPMFTTQEILITDAVTVLPRPVGKDPEENRAFLDPSATQPVFGRCQTSYVGVPGAQEAAPCPGNASYTRLPSSVWGFVPGEERVASSPDFLEISRSDSGCSCEDLTQSPESDTVPSGAVVDATPTPHSNDYCVLNKTAEGMVPVLVSN